MRAWGQFVSNSEYTVVMRWLPPTESSRIFIFEHRCIQQQHRGESEQKSKIKRYGSVGLRASALIRISNGFILVKTCTLETRSWLAFYGCYYWPGGRKWVLDHRLNGRSHWSGSKLCVWSSTHKTRSIRQYLLIACSFRRTCAVGKL